MRHHEHDEHPDHHGSGEPFHCDGERLGRHPEPRRRPRHVPAMVHCPVCGHHRPSAYPYMPSPDERGELRGTVVLAVAAAALLVLTVALTPPTPPAPTPTPA
ncbi:hypothetical protein E0L36_04580 [Streptomyces sp. AJS327]|uniref:hypothetical protein n=1 Tax=Streptomyces sp. AJS327 TaxID=2545265 RepID=UPI0015DF83C5|nr:hypothetical protein [Streptomyces sp. AJS327]MBA0050199.1 hypothetical protein [Streptomyces sp. AJS327]